MLNAFVIDSPATNHVRNVSQRDSQERHGLKMDSMERDSLEKDST